MLQYNESRLRKIAGTTFKMVHVFYNLGPPTQK